MKRAMWLCFVVLLSAESVEAAPYTITDLGNLGSASFATGINNRGQVVGYSFHSDQVTARPFLYSNGVMQDLGTLGGSFCKATAINDLGQVVGSSGLSDRPYDAAHAFLYSAGAMQDLGTIPGWYNSYPTGINNLGQIVGNGDQYSFIYSDGQMQSRGTFGRIITTATGISDAGQIAGYSYQSGQNATHGFLYQNGVMEDIGTLGGSLGALVYGINQLGQVVGSAYGNGGANEGASLYTAGNAQIVGGSYGYAVNNRGDLVGQQILNNQVNHAFVYTDGQLQDLNSLIDPALGWILL